MQATPKASERPAGDARRKGARPARRPPRRDSPPLWTRSGPRLARRDLLLGALLVLMALAAYAQVYGGDYGRADGRVAANPGFIWDDEDYVFENPHLPDPGGLERIWFHPRESPQYYPLVFTTFWLEYRLWGGPDEQGRLKANGYHLTNVLLHALNALLLWVLLRRLRLRAAWAVAAVFALHPFCVESVAWVTERKNVLSLFFYLLAALALLRWEARSGPGRWGWWGLGLALFLLGLFSKTVIASLPLALMIARWWRGERITRAYAFALAPFLALGFAMGRMTAAHERDIVLWGDVGPYWDLSFLERVLIAGRALWFYVGKILWPHPLVFNYRRWTIDAGDPLQWLWPLAALAALGALLWIARRGRRGPLAAGLFYAVTLFPALGFVNVAPMRFSFVADHFAYLAGIGVIALVVEGAAGWWARPAGGPRARAAVAALAALLALLGLLTWKQTRIYLDVEDLYRHTIRHYPESHLARVNLAAILRRRGEIDEARGHYERVLLDWPDWPWTRARALTGLGNLEQEAGRLEEAERLFREAAELTPVAPEPGYNHANALLLQGRYEEALGEYERVLALLPGHAQARYNLGYALEQLGRFADAQAHYARVTREKPGFALGWTGLARMEQRRGQPEKAIDHYRRARQLDPGSSGILMGEMEALLQAGRRGEGLAIAQTLAGSGAPDPALTFEVARRLRAAGEHADAVRALRGALVVRPDDRRLRMLLAEQLAAAPDDAVRDGEEALGLALALRDDFGADDPGLLAVLGVAYAEAGRFGEASAALRRGEDLARRSGRDDLLPTLIERREAADAGRGWRLPRRGEQR